MIFVLSVYSRMCNWIVRARIRGVINLSNAAVSTVPSHSVRALVSFYNFSHITRLIFWVFVSATINNHSLWIGFPSLVFHGLFVTGGTFSSLI